MNKTEMLIKEVFVLFDFFLYVDINLNKGSSRNFRKYRKI